MNDFYPNFYDILGRISKEASQESIKKAYRTLASVYHPDKNPHDAFNAKEKMQELNEAYKILSNPKKRSEYNEKLSMYEEQQKQNNDNSKDTNNGSQNHDTKYNEDKTTNSKNWNFTQSSNFNEAPKSQNDYSWVAPVAVAVVGIGLLAILYTTGKKK
jgi:DnaJ-class molecular chaperone